MKIALYLDTSVLGFGFILKEIGGEEKILHRLVDSSRSASSFKLSSLLAEKLKDLGLDEKAIDTVIVSKGPGSFTGIRIGLAWAQGFCIANKARKLIAVSSLSYAASYLSKKYHLDSLSLVLANTKTTAFLALYEKNKGCSLNFLDETYEFSLDNKNVFVDSFYEKREKASPYKILSKEELGELTIDALAEGVDLKDQKLYAQSTVIEPLYLRKSSVEEKLS